MRSVFITIVIIVFASTGLAFVTGNLSRQRENMRRESGPGEVIPSNVLKLITLDFKGIFSDFAFFRAYQYYGGKILKNEPMTERDWQWFSQTLNVSTDLDPFFLDPYYLGAMSLAWQANKVDLADALLAKGTRERTWDWTLPYYLGFNYFYFYHDNAKAGRYLMEAGSRPGGSAGLVPSLASRLANAGGETESAIAFLESILRKTSSKSLRYIYGMRLNALQRVFYLEQATKLFRKRFRRVPRSLEELVKKGIIKEIPRDPYGGKFYITQDGSIQTTSNFMVVRK